MITSIGESVLARSTWLGALLCLLLRFTDRALTIARGRLYRRQDKVIFEGSYEINPKSQVDVDALRVFSRRFVWMLLLPPATVLTARLYAGSNDNLLVWYLFVVGFFVLPQLVVHLQHINSLYSFMAVIPHARGHLEYPRQAFVRGSAMYFAEFAVLFVAVFAVTESMFVLGGVWGCVIIAALHYRLSLRGSNK